MLSHLDSGGGGGNGGRGSRGGASKLSAVACCCNACLFLQETDSPQTNRKLGGTPKEMMFQATD
jgi:hypothetical protein